MNQINSKGPEEESKMMFALGVDTNQQDEQLSFSDLMKQAELATEQLELEKAVKLYDQGLKQYPNETSLIDAYTDLLLSLPD